jgi:hypothetical protein
MRLFQNAGIYPSYLPRLNALAREASRFEERRRAFLDDRFGALHFLKPVLEGDAEAFFTNGDDEILQRQWARENALRADASLEDILLAQIEHHRTEIFYNSDPMRYPSAFVRKLPGCVRKSICWRAAPSGRADLMAYDAVLANFPSILESWRRNGCRAEWFAPAIDPAMETYGHGERPIDVLFVGGYSRHHLARARILEQVARLADTFNIIYCLDASRLTKLAESVIGRLLPLQKHRRAAAIAKIAGSPVFGRALYELIGRSKIVLNGAIDMAGEDRGNMRCFEAMGCGALLVSDAGKYPDGMIANETMVTYQTGGDCVEQIKRCLADWPSMGKMAETGRSWLSELYSKERQWISFERIVARL